ncbi:MAG: STAS domain-containing protein [Acidobacteriia bacterium]|nr:STAS domain-containing protein [Terriglobia bacterium]
MEITVRKQGETTILDLSGNLILGPPVALFREKILELLEAGDKVIAVNLASVSFLDSSGIGAMIGARTSIESKGGKLCFYSALPRVIRTLETAHVDEVLNIQRNEAAALASFGSTV